MNKKSDEKNPWRLFARLVLGVSMLTLTGVGHARLITTSSSAYGESVNLVLTVPLVGNVAVTSGPLPVSAGIAPGPYADSDTALSASVSALGLVNLGTGVLDTYANSTVDGSIGPKTTGAAATVNNLGLNIFTGLFSLTADKVESSAAFSGDFNSLSAAGTATLTNASVSSLLLSAGLAANPAPNTQVDVLGLLGLTGVSLTLNEQIATGAGTNSQSLAVNAIHLSFNNFASGLNVLNGDIVISHSQAQATAFRDANPVIQNPQPIDFGKVRINTSAAQALSIQNDVPNDGFSEKLNASAGTTTGGVTAAGSFTQLAPGATNNTGIQVGLDTSVAGDRSGTATIQFETDGTEVAGNGLGPAALPSQEVQVTGEVYRLASPVLNTPSITLAARVGDPGPSAAISLTNASPDPYTEGLKALPGAAPAGFTATGGIDNLAAQGTDATSLGVSLETSTAGSFGGNLSLNLASTGAGTTGAPDLALPGQDVALAGKVYTPAVAQVNTPSVNFGIVHVGDTVAAQSISVTNAAPATALNDVLLGSVSASGPFSGAGNLGAGLGAGAADPTSLTVSLATGTAGVFNGHTATLSFLSHDADLADLNLGDAAVTLNGQVNNYAHGSLLLTGGDGQFTQPGSHEYVLDFGNVIQGTGPLETFLAVLNDVAGPADLLDGVFDVSGAGNLVLAGFSDFVDLMAGGMRSGLNIRFDPAALGLLNDTIILSIFGHNDSGYRALEETLTFRILGNVVPTAQVPEPGVLLLEVVALLAMRRFRPRPFRAR